jgi:hypothetical protein
MSANQGMFQGELSADYPRVTLETVDGEMFAGIHSAADWREHAARLRDAVDGVAETEDAILAAAAHIAVRRDVFGTVDRAILHSKGRLAAANPCTPAAAVRLVGLFPPFSLHFRPLSRPTGTASTKAAEDARCAAA